MSEASESAEKPFLLVVAGPNGSGKTTLTKMLREAGVNFGHYVNPDEISASLEGPQYERDRRAQQMAAEARRAHLDAGRSHSYETVMSHPSHLAFMREARDKGYDVILYFISLSNPEINMARIANRVALGGHDVPPEKTVSRYEKVMKDVLPKAVRTVTSAQIFDNSSPDAAPRAVAALREGRLVVLVNDVPEWVRSRLIEPLVKAGDIPVEPSVI